MKNLHTKKTYNGSDFGWLIRQMSINQKSGRQTFRRRFVSLFVSPCPPESYLQSETKIEPDLRLRSQLRFSLPSIIITITSNEPWNTESTKRIEIRQSQTMTFWTRWSKLLFPKRCAKMIDGSEKRKRQLAFELQNSSVYENRSNFCDFQKVPSIQHW